MATYGHLVRKGLIQSKMNTLLADTLLLGTLAAADKIQIPGESYASLTENESSYYGLSPDYGIRTLSWYQNDNHIVLTLNKADTTYFGV